MTPSLWLWGSFHLFVLVLLALNLGYFHRQTSIPTLRRTSLWTAVWLALARGSKAVRQWNCQELAKSHGETGRMSGALASA